MTDTGTDRICAPSDVHAKTFHPHFYPHRYINHRLHINIEFFFIVQKSLVSLIISEKKLKTEQLTVEL